MIILFPKKNFSKDIFILTGKRWADYSVIQKAIVSLILMGIANTGLKDTLADPLVYYGIVGIYMLFKDVLLGKSLGKHLFKLDIVKLNCNKASFAQKIIRNVPLALPYGELLEGIWIVINVLFNGSSRRLGDILARTYIIDEYYQKR